MFLAALTNLFGKNNDQYNTDEMDILWEQHPKYNKNNIMQCVLNYVVMFVAVYEMIFVAVWDGIFMATPFPI